MAHAVVLPPRRLALHTMFPRISLVLGKPQLDLTLVMTLKKLIAEPSTVSLI
jgi:hypothetical protein